MVQEDRTGIGSLIKEKIARFRRIFVHKLNAKEITVGTVKEKVSGSGVTFDDTLNVSTIKTASGDLILDPVGNVHIGTDGTGTILTLQPVDGVNEGGELHVGGAAANADWVLDNYAGTIRLLRAGVPIATWSDTAFDLTGDVTIAATKSLTTDTIHEKTPGAGITVDGLLIKDNFMEVEEIPTPANPALNNLRIFARASGENIVLIARSSQGAEAVLATLDDTAGAHTNTLGLNWIE